MRYLMAAALLPAVALMWYIWKKDRIEPESLSLVKNLALLGALTTIPASILELIGGKLLRTFLPETGYVYLFLFYFLFVAGSEELGKFLVLRIRTWNSPAFSFTYDAVVYAVAASLGFAALENVLYVVLSGFGTAILRAVTAVPGHAVFGVFMGYHYGIAKRAAVYGDRALARREMLLTYLVPVLLHGCYDFLLSLEGDLWILLFFAFYLAILIAAFVKIRKLSEEDGPVDPDQFIG